MPPLPRRSSRISTQQTEINKQALNDGAVAIKESEATEEETTTRHKALLYSTLLALQFGLQPVIFKKCSVANISKYSLVLVTEITKILITILMLIHNGSETRTKIRAIWSFSDSLQVSALPAALYTVQNILMLSGCELLDALTVNLFNQTKTLSAALFLYVVMGLRQSKMQLFALFLMLISAVILTTPDSESLLKFSSISDTSKYLTGAVFGFQDQK